MTISKLVWEINVKQINLNDLSRIVNAIPNNIENSCLKSGASEVVNSQRMEVLTIWKEILLMYFCKEGNSIVQFSWPY